jgi:RNA processing factor Prp31
MSNAAQAAAFLAEWDQVTSDEIDKLANDNETYAFVAALADMLESNPEHVIRGLDFKLLRWVRQLAIDRACYLLLEATQWSGA